MTTSKDNSPNVLSTPIAAQISQNPNNADTFSNPPNSKMSQPHSHSNSLSNNLSDALADLNSAIESWEKITSKPPSEQDVSLVGLEMQTKEILIKLREQLNELSED